MIITKDIFSIGILLFYLKIRTVLLQQNDRHPIMDILHNKIKKDFEIVRFDNNNFDKYLTIMFKPIAGKTLDDCEIEAVKAYNPTEMMCTMVKLKSKSNRKNSKKSLNICKCSLHYYKSYKIGDHQYYLLSLETNSRWHRFSNIKGGR